jgi:hypothetical protein
VQNEGDIGVGTKGPYEIAYGSLVPKRGQCDNLLVPVCVSSSHIAFGSIRMEPVFMILGQSAATAAVMAIEANQAVQDVPYAKLRTRLIQDGQILEHEGGTADQRSIDHRKLSGVVIDDSRAKVTGHWKESTASHQWVGDNYRHDGNSGDGESTARFEAKLPKAGLYDVRLAYTPNENRATNVTVEVHHAKGKQTVTVNQQRTPTLDGVFISLGVFDFTPERPAVVTLSNRDTNGYVIIDAVRWVEAAR